MKQNKKQNLQDTAERNQRPELKDMFLDWEA